MPGDSIAPSGASPVSSNSSLPDDRPPTSDSSSTRFETSSLSAAIFEAGDRAASVPPVPKIPFLASSASVTTGTSTSTLPNINIPHSQTHLPHPEASDLTPITENIYITSLSGASNAMSVARENITHVLSLTISKPHLPSLPPPTADPIHYHIPLENTPNSPLLERIPEITMLIYEALHDPDIDSPKILVHCDFGLSRAPAVVIGYLMATGGLSFREGIRIVQEKRGNVCLNLGFVRALSKWASVRDDFWANGIPTKRKEQETDNTMEIDDTFVDLPRLAPMSMLDGGRSVKTKTPPRTVPSRSRDEIAMDTDDANTSKTGTLDKIERRASVILLEKKQEWEKMKRKKAWKRFRCW